jgi:hypothetical protein
METISIRNGDNDLSDYTASHLRKKKTVFWEYIKHRLHCIWGCLGDRTTRSHNQEVSMLWGSVHAIPSLLKKIMIRKKTTSISFQYYSINEQVSTPTPLTLLHTVNMSFAATCLLARKIMNASLKKICSRLQCVNVKNKTDGLKKYNNKFCWRFKKIEEFGIRIGAGYTELHIILITGNIARGPV